MNPVLRGTIALLALWPAVASMADETGISVGWAAGLEMARGNYGGDSDIEDLYVPFKLHVNGERTYFELTVPYLRVRAPEGTSGGLGDIVAGMTVYDVLYSSKARMALDLTGKVKFGTASADDGLGTGETDLTIIADVVKFLDGTMLVGSVGYKFRGEPDGIDLEDGLLVSVGGQWRLNDATWTGLYYDYREAAIVGDESLRELSLHVTRARDDDHDFRFFVYKGLSDAAADWGAGFRYHMM